LTTYPFHVQVLGVVSLEIQQPGREADHSPPASAEVKNEWNYTSIRHAPSWHAQRQLSVPLLALERAETCCGSDFEKMDSRNVRFWRFCLWRCS